VGCVQLCNFNRVETTFPVLLQLCGVEVDWPVLVPALKLTAARGCQLAYCYCSKLCADVLNMLWYLVVTLDRTDHDLKRPGLVRSVQRLDPLEVIQTIILQRDIVAKHVKNECGLLFLDQGHISFHVDLVQGIGFLDNYFSIIDHFLGLDDLMRDEGPIVMLTAPLNLAVCSQPQF